MDTPDPVTRLNSALSGRYRIKREIGEGGMATVYLATMSRIASGRSVSSRLRRSVFAISEQRRMRVD